MDDATIFCSFCKKHVFRNELYAHVERSHVGSQTKLGFYEISCGSCIFRVSHHDESNMIEHCFQTKHKTSNLSLDWNYFVRKESQRIVDTISSAVELLEEEDYGSRNMFQEVPKASQPSHPGRSKAKRPPKRPYSDSMDYADVEGSIEEDYDPEEMPQAIFCGPATSEPSTQRRRGSRIKRLSTKSEIKNTTPSSSSHNEFRNGDSPSEPLPDKSNLTEILDALSDESAQTIDADLESTDTGRDGNDTPLKKKRSTSPGAKPGSKAQQKNDRHINKVRCASCAKPVDITGTRTPKQILLNHVLGHTGEKLIKCIICSKEFENKTAFDRHTRVEKACKKAKCEAQITEEKMTTLRNQLQAAFPDHQFKDVAIKSLLVESQEKLRGRGRPKGTGGLAEIAKTLSCGFCEKGYFAHVNHIISHIISHSKLKLFRCKACGKILSGTCSATGHVERACAQSNGTIDDIVCCATPENVEQIRELLKKGFPTLDWNDLLAPGIVRLGITF